MKNKDTQQLGISVYIHALRKQIEEEVESDTQNESNI